MNIKEEKFIKLYWWNKSFKENNKYKYNIGDMLSKIVVEFVSKKNTIYSGVGDSNKLCAIGSIINNSTLSSGGFFWGSGLLNDNITFYPNRTKFFSVRGPLSRKILKEKGYNVPEIYGDPALLLPLIYKPKIKKKYKYGIITHWRHKGYINYGDGVLDINILRSFEEIYTFIDEICSCEYILSSSLHGIIISHAYGIPATLISIDDVPLEGKPLLKFKDYYYSINQKFYEPYILKKYDFIDSNTKLKINKNIDLNIDINKLLESFPNDLNCEDYNIHKKLYTSIKDIYSNQNIVNYAYYLFKNEAFICALFLYIMMSLHSKTIFNINIDICIKRIIERRYNIYLDKKIIFNIFYNIYDRCDFKKLITAEQILYNKLDNLYIKNIKVFHESFFYKYKVSFIIPVYNNEYEIYNCLKSIERQNISSYEIIFIDDNSSDNSVEIIKKIQNYNKNITLIKNKTNKGPGYSRNIGISYAKGEYIRCIDCDDIIPDSSTRIMIDKLKTYNVDIVKGSFICKNENNNILFERKFKNDFVLQIKDLEINNINNICNGHWSFLIRKKIIEQNNLFYPENIRNCEDSIFINELIFSSNKILCIKDITYEYIASTSCNKLHNKKNFTIIKSLQLLFDLWLYNCKKLPM